MLCRLEARGGGRKLARNGSGCDSGAVPLLVLLLRLLSPRVF